MSHIFSSYRAPAWLPGANIQTIYPALFAPKTLPAYQRERWETPDADFVDLDFVFPEKPAKGLLVLFHGLEGSSASQYAVSAMRAATSADWIGCVPHFRGCSGEINRAPRAYHSGDSDEIAWILERLAGLYPDLPRYACGISLGGNALLKWAGLAGDSASQMVDAVAGVSAPQDLQAGAAALAKGFPRVYARAFFKTMREKSLQKLAQYPGLFNRETMLRSRDFFAYDDAVTAPIHGFNSCFDYWGRSSCKRYLGDIKIPALVFNARNDPFLPERHLARPDQVSHSVQLAYPATGGHVGFISGPMPGRIGWSGEQLVRWFQHG
ncbi:MAG: YheT family hydrolase [Burkholderiaceae bacterium]